MTHKKSLLASVALASMALAYAGAAWAQEAEQPVELAQVEEDPTDVGAIVVTGSLIRGSSEAAALPVDVVTAADMEKQGSPPIIDLVKSIPAVTGGIAGETNQFRAGQSTGTSNVNLRGLGPQRTLVLLNGQRVAVSPAAGIGVDTNLLPWAAIQRIEVLKDGAAATYGSDAIGGVVNFITRQNLSGLEIGVSHTFIEGSDGDSTAFVNWGWVGDRSNVLLSAGYRHRSELDTLERDYAVPDFDLNPGGSWSGFGNPGTYATSPVLALATRFSDPACETLGSVARTSLTGTPTCYFQFGRFNNLVEEENHLQVFGEFNYDLSDTIQWHVEALYGWHDVPNEGTSPSYGPTQGPSVAVSTGVAPGIWVIPRANPGITPEFIALLPAAQRAALEAGGNLYTTGLFWRPFGVGGNPLTGGSKPDKREFDGWRFSTGLTGDFANGMGWDVNYTYSLNRSDIATPDIVVSRLQAALRGLGGPGCDTDPVTPGVQGGVAGVGPCQWFNPFSTGIAAHAATGQVNNLTYAGDGSPAALAGPQNRALGEWLFEDYAYKSKTGLATINAVLTGELPFELSGGPIGFALGSAYSRTTFDREVNDISNLDVNPCVDEGFTGCPELGRNGALSFFGALRDQHFDNDVIAYFGELQVPVTETIQTQLAIRYERYGNGVGSTTNPKVAVRWQMVPALALRASAGSTFRAPPENQLAPDSTTNLVFTTEAGGYRPYDNFGNPDLDPETADTFNLGLLFDQGPLRASIDYFKFKFEDNINTESGTRMVSTLIANNCSPDLGEAFLSRFTLTAGAPPLAPSATPNTGTCSAANIARTKVLIVNGEGIETSGIDAVIDFRFQDFRGGDLRLGAEATHVIEYIANEQTVEGVVVRQAADFVGTLDLTLGSIPEWKGSAFIEYARGSHNARWTVRYLDGMEDTRTGKYGGTNIFGPGASGNQVAGFANTAGMVIDEFVTHDFVYRVDLPSDISASLAVLNVFDEEPPFARLDLSYDPFTANPLGRHFRVNLTKRF